MSQLVPYVISEAHPDYKSPSVKTIYGFVSQDELDNFLLNELVKFVWNFNDRFDLDSVDDIVNFWDNFYGNWSMMNPPWEAKAVINGKWIDVTPSDEKLFEKLVDYKKKHCDW